MYLLKEIILSLLLSVLVGSLLAQELVLDSISPFSNIEAACKKPVWSPDGERILFVSGDNALCYMDVASGAVEEIQSAPLAKTDVGWYNNSTVKYKSSNIINSSKIAEAKTPTSQNIDFAFVDKNERRLYKYSSKDSVSLVIAEEKANYYNPLLSPDGAKAVAHIGAYIYLFAVDGSVEKERITKGLAHSWSPCGNYLFYFVDESSDGHTLENSDIYAYDLQKKTVSTLTQTDDMMEMWPAVSPNGTQLVFTDERTGALYIANIKTEE